MPQITIQLNPLNGQIAFESNVPSDIMFYGMLEATRQMFAKMMAEQQDRKITLAPGGLQVRA